MHAIHGRERSVLEYLASLQDRICRALEELEPRERFQEDAWRRPGLGEGWTRVIEDGETFEKGGVNVSLVQGDALPRAATERRPDLAGCGYAACGISLVLHPRNPFVPTVHANLRYFEARGGSANDAWWFGGGMDLTPVYGFEDDVVHWHRTLREACREYGEGIYDEFKEWCDRYFTLPHRNETRGVGGVFFDDLNRWEFGRCFAFVRTMGETFLPAYLPIVRRRRETPYAERHRGFQQIRRGRYVEFNLLYDRGTRFGLESGGRAESILMSMPPVARWKYRFEPEPGSEEARLVERFLQPRNWAAIRRDERVP